MTDTAPAPKPAPKPAARKAAKPHKKPVQPPKPRTPLEVAKAEFAAQIIALQQKQALVEKLPEATRLIRLAITSHPELIDVIQSDVGHVRLNAPPDGRARKAALEMLTEQQRDRLDDLFRSGALAVVTDPVTGRDALVGVIGEDTLTVVCRAMWPDQYPASLPAPAPTDTAPGSPERQAEYARRVEAGEAMHAEGDRDDLTGEVLVERLNGMGKRVLSRGEAAERAAPEEEADDDE